MESPIYVLGIDLGVTVGMAIVEIDSHQLWFFQSRHPVSIEQGLSLRDDLVEYFDLWEPLQVVVETPALHSGQRYHKYYLGLQQEIERVIEEYEQAPVVYVTPGVWKNSRIPAMFPGSWSGTGNRHIDDAVHIALWWAIDGRVAERSKQ